MIDAIDVLARLIHASLRGLARAGFPPAARLSPSELGGSAHLLACGMFGAAWHARRGAPSWADLSRGWERAADEIASAALHGRFDPADRVELLTDNARAFAARAELIDAARARVDLATYYLQADETGRALSARLRAAAARGVRVRLVADGYIMRKKDYEGLGVMALVRDLRAAGVDVHLFRDPARPYDTNHRKLLVVDGEALILGGRNVADHYAGDAWRDVELLLRGPSARAAEALFERTRRGDPEPPRRPGAPDAYLQATAPGDVARHANFIYLLQCVRDARRTVDVENAYFLEHPAVLRGLRAARARGVRVRVFTNSAESNDLDYANYRLYAGFSGMLDAGIELYLRRGKGRTLHSKYFVIDGRWNSVGSSNLDYYSPRYCTEANVQVESPELAAALTAYFEAGIAEADRLVDPAVIDHVLRGSSVSRAIDALLRDVQ